MNFEKKKILVVVAHPDDEILGLGASMHRLIHNFNCDVRVVILGEGITSRSDHRDTHAWKKELGIHKSDIDLARRKIGYKSVGVYDFPDNRFDTVALLDIVKIIEREKEDFQPEIIFTHHGGDLNIDHQKTFEAVMTACRPMKDEIVKTIITFETMSGTEWRPSSDPRHFLPNFFLSVSSRDLEAKIEAMECYSFEKRQFPHPRSPQALKVRSSMWGITVGVEFAEAFQLIRFLHL